MEGSAPAEVLFHRLLFDKRDIGIVDGLAQLDQPVALCFELRELLFCFRRRMLPRFRPVGAALLYGDLAIELRDRIVKMPAVPAARAALRRRDGFLGRIRRARRSAFPLER